MSDLISRKKAVETAKQFWYKPDVANALSELPSADIMECARAIKEYCKKRDCCKGCCLEDLCIWGLPEPYKGVSE